MNAYALKTKKSPQKIRTSFTKENGLPSDNITALCYGINEEVWIGTDCGLALFAEGKLDLIEKITDSVSCIYACACSKVFVSAAEYVYILEGKAISCVQKIDGPAVNICRDDAGTLWLATKLNLYQYTDGSFVRHSGIEFGNTTCMTACLDRRVYCSCPNALMMLFGKRPRWGAMMRGMTSLPESEITALASDSCGYVWVGCKDGVHLFDGKSEWISPDELQYFPKCEITKIVFGADGTAFIGTVIGLYIVNGIRTNFLGKGRYLSDSKVTAIAVNDNSNEYWVGTEKGLSRIEIKEMSLSEKEEYFDSIMHNFSREGYMTGCHGEPGKALGEGKQTVSITDNDGLWTSVYCVSQCLKYAVTDSKTALENARTSMHAILKLMTMSGVKGFPARAYRRPGEDRFGNGDPEWHLSSDEKGELEWKGETSSDELVGHFFASAWYYDLCANDEEKEEIKNAIVDIVEHILTHEYTLCDADGLPTTWAHFGPEALNGDEKWCWEKGINSLELLAFLKTAYYMSNEKKYDELYRELITRHHYMMNLLTHKKFDCHSNHIDDRLGFYTTTVLLRYETDPRLRKYLLLATRRHYEYEKVENHPLYGFIYSYFTGAHCELDNGIKTLEEFPLDTYCYEVKNSIRPDIEIDDGPVYYGGVPQAKYAIPCDERKTDRMSACAFTLDANGGAHHSTPTSWLISYWFGRYAGMIEE